MELSELKIYLQNNKEIVRNYLKDKKLFINDELCNVNYYVKYNIETDRIVETFIKREINEIFSTHDLLNFIQTSITLYHHPNTSTKVFVDRLVKYIKLYNIVNA